LNTRAIVLVVALLAGGLIALSLWYEPAEAVVAEAGAAGAPDAAEAAGARPEAELARPGTAGAGVGEPARLAEPREVAERLAESAAAPVPAGPTGRAVAGRVVDSLGNPVADAEVRYLRDHGFGIRVFGNEDHAPAHAALTGADGRFELEDVSSSSLNLAVRASGFAPLDKRGVSVPEQGTRDLGDLVVVQGVFLRGRVVDSAGRGVAGAVLHREDPEVRSFGFGARSEPLTTTESDGSFLVDHLAAGPWRVRVNSEEHPSRLFEGITERPGEDVGGLVFELPPGGVIEGFVTGLSDGPVRDEIFVRAMPGDGDGFFGTFGPGVREAELDEAGRFRLVGLQVDTPYRVQARKRDSSARGFSGSSSLSQAVTANAGERGVELLFQLPATVTAKVVDDKTGQPIEEFLASGGMRWMQPVRDEDGQILRRHPGGVVSFDELRARSSEDRLNFEITAVGYEEYRRDGVQVAPGSAQDLGEIRLVSVPVLRVTVTDEVTGAPIDGADITLAIDKPEANLPGAGGERRISFDVRVEDDGSGPVVVSGNGEQRRARTDDTGVAAISSFEGELCTLRVEAPGYAPFELKSLSLPRGTLVDQSVELGRGASVIVTVRTPEGLPAADLVINHSAPGADPFMSHFGGGHGEYRTDVDGRVRFDHLEPGVHSFQIEEGGSGGAWLGDDRVVVAAGGHSDADEWSRIEVAERGEYQLAMTTAAVGTLTGKVTEAGKPLAGATLELEERSENADPQAAAMRMFGGGGPKVRTDGGGRFAFEDVEEGDYTLKVTHASRAMADEFDVRIRTGSRSEDFDLPISILEGRVTGPDGEPLAGVKVSAERAAEPGAPRVQAFRVMMVTDGGDEAVSFSDGSMAEFALTDEDGRYVLRGVTPDVDLVVNGEYSSAQPGSSDPVRVAADESRRGVDLVLEPAGSLKVSAYNADGTTAQFLMVAANLVEDESVTERGFIGPSGSATLSGLRPGVWNVSLRPAGPMGGEIEPPEPQQAEVLVGEVRELDFNL